MVNNSGGVYVADLFRIAIYFSILCTFIFIPTPFIRYIQLTHICEVVVENVQKCGTINEETYVLFNNLAAKYNINPSIDFTGGFVSINGEQRIQMQDEFSIIISDDVELYAFLPGLTEKLTYSMELSKEIVGTGHFYWRDSEI